jgi:hypothetical protein
MSSQSKPTILYDAFAREGGRVEAIVGRPRIWHCGKCGTRQETQGGFHCTQCSEVRPLITVDATLVSCNECGKWNAFCTFCEWCGAKMRW